MPAFDALDAPELPYLHPPVTARVRYEACLRGSQVFLSSLPTTSTGKIMRRKLADAPPPQT